MPRQCDLRTRPEKWERGVEEPEVARVGHVHDAVLELHNAPSQQFIERPWRAKIEPCEFLLESIEIERRYDRSLHDALVGARQLARKKVIQPRALGAGREECRWRCADPLS
jgi:hypothetical protein